MEKINISRVMWGGLLASVVFIIIEFIVEGFVNLVFGFDEANLARQYFPDIILSGVSYQVVNIIYLISTCTLTIWLYAALCPKFGVGPKTAIISSLLVIILIFLFMVNHINMGIYPLKPALISLVISLVEFPISIVAGSSFYKSK
jgi:hypothetical protein